MTFSNFFFFKQKTAYEISACLVGSEMCIRDRYLLHAVVAEFIRIPAGIIHRFIVKCQAVFPERFDTTLIALGAGVGNRAVAAENDDVPVPTA